MLNIPRNDRLPDKPRRLAAIGLSTLLLAMTGCATQPPIPVGTSGTLPAGPVVATQAAPANAIRYQIDPNLSDVRFLVFRAGPLARLGHNHVIQARNIRGEIRLADDIRRSSFTIALPVKDFLVDAAQARADEGEAFSPQPDGEAIAGTAANMLGEKVLDAASYPTVDIKSLAANGPPWGMDVTLSVTLHGTARDMTVPTALELSGETLVATAFFAFKQTDFGVTPMSVLGGGLQVDNTVKVRMRIVARKATVQ